MYNQTYEDYIRSVLGYPNYSDQDFYMDYNYNPYNCNTCNYNQSQNQELEECYPEIYKKVYPIVKAKCQKLVGPLTKEKIDMTVDEICSNIEINDEIYLNINLNNNVETRTNTARNVDQSVERQIEHKVIRNAEQKNNRAIDRQSEPIKETRRFNRGLSDIIRILLLRELLGRPGYPGNRPPFPPPHGRPPFPPNMPPRPPFNRDFNNLYEY